MTTLIERRETENSAADRAAPTGPERTTRGFWLGLAIALAGLLATIAGQVLLRPRSDLTPGIWLLAGGALAVAAGILLSSRALPVRWPAAWPGPRLQPGAPCRPAVAGVGAALLLGLVAVILWLAAGFNTTVGNLAALIWVLGLVVALVALLAGSRRDVAPDGAPATGPARPAVAAGEAAGPARAMAAEPTGARVSADGQTRAAPFPTRSAGTHLTAHGVPAFIRPRPKRWAGWLPQSHPPEPPAAVTATTPTRSWGALPLGLVLLGVFLVALAVRVYYLGDVPFGVWFDEAETGLEARRLLGGANFEPIGQNFGREPIAYFYLVAVSFLVFGESIFAVRLVTAVIGAFAAVGVTLLGRELFGWRVGLAAGLFLAFSRWQIDFSRFGMITVSASMLAAFGFWLLARAVRRDRLADYGLAGLAFGIGFHGYAGFRLIFGAALVALVAGFIVRRVRPGPAVGRLAVWGALVLLAGLPVLLFAARFPQEYNKRAAETFIFTGKNTTEERVAAVVNTTKAHLLMFHYEGDRNGRHNLAGEPMVDPVAGVLLAIGVAWSLLRVLDWRYLVLIAWGLAALAGGIFSIEWEAPQAARTIAITPALALWSALGLVLLLDRLRAGIDRVVPAVAEGTWPVRRLGPAAAALVAVPVIGYSGWQTVDIYFNRQMPTRSTWLEFSPRETILTNQAVRLRNEYPRVLTSQTLLNHPVQRLHAPHHRNFHAFSPVGDLPLRTAEGTLIYLDDRDKALWEEVRRFYPDAPVRHYSPPDTDDPILAEFRISKEVIEARQGLSGTFRGSDGAVRSERSATVAVDWTAGQPPVPFPFGAEWAGGLSVEASGDYTFDIPAGFTLTIDGRAFPAAEFPNGLTVPLARGNHTIHLAGEVTEPRDVRLLWRTPTGGAPHPIPTERLYHGVAGGTGLLGEYYPGREWSGRPAKQQIDPVLAIYYHLLPMRRPYTVEWRGMVEVPVAGSFQIGLEQVSEATVWIDGQEVLANRQGNSYQERPIEVSAGRHDIRVRFLDADGGSHVYLFWTPPNGERTAIPGRYFYPPAPEPIR